MKARAINLPTIQVALSVSLNNRLLKEAELSQQALSTGWLLQQASLALILTFPADGNCRTGDNVVPDEHELQLAEPAAAGARLDVCNTGANCNKVSEGDPTGPIGPIGCIVGRVLLTRVLI
jgi:hypothetical protein